MPNELQFEIEFTREELEQIISIPDAEFIVVSGSYKYEGKDTTGNDKWTMKPEVQLYDSNRNKMAPVVPIPSGCPKPCP